MCEAVLDYPSDRPGILFVLTIWFMAQGDGFWCVSFYQGVESLQGFVGSYAQSFMHVSRSMPTNLDQLHTRKQSYLVLICDLYLEN